MAELEQLLEKTSRTFALAIPFLPNPPRREVGTAYLLFRIADTFEDATRWPRVERLEALASFQALVREPNPEKAERLARQWVVSRPCDHEGYLELLAKTPGVLAVLGSFSDSRREIVVRHTVRTAEGMAGFVERGDSEGGLKLTNRDELRRYCYVVAGIVGELLTDLFIDASPNLRSIEAKLRERAAAFGEGLQLVNILKDSDSDARDGRVYLPPGIARTEILALAREDLRAASEYVLGLQQAGAPRGMVEFTALPVLLARASLRRLETSGPGSKISRNEVALLMGQLQVDLDSGAPVVTAG